MQLGQQRAEQDSAMMNVQDWVNLTADTPLQLWVGDMAPIGMHVIPHQKEFWSQKETVISILYMAVEPGTFFHELQIAHFLAKMVNSFQKR